MSETATRSDLAALSALARRRGVATSYVDASGARKTTSARTLVAILNALGEEIAHPADAVQITKQCSADRAAADAKAVVAWDGVPGRFRLGAAPNRGDLELEITFEGHTSSQRLSGQLDADGQITIAEIVPFGIHQLRRRDLDCTVPVVSAPRRLRHRGAARRDWSLFAPTYALRDRRGRPAGDLTSLQKLGELVGSLGGRGVATLPLLAELATADGADPGQHPYSPISRMWWNEAYLDLAALPELRGVDLTMIAPRTRDGDRSPADLAGIASGARPALSEAARRLAASDSARRRAFRAFRRNRPEFERYVRFRAAVEVGGHDWRRWPPRWRAGNIAARDLPPEALDRHAYAQWAVDSQLADVAAALGRRGCGLVLDLPVGCRPDGFDPWAFRDAFVAGASIGSPPDDFFTSGQNWGFAPPRPEIERVRGYSLLRNSLIHNLVHASVLRIDHVMGLSRLWWVPDGMEPSQGAYVHYPFEEILAIACLEASRHNTELIGENLGTVEAGLSARLRRHGVAGMAVACFELESHPDKPIETPAMTAAYVDTHDSPPFASWLDGSDLQLRHQLGMIDDVELVKERTERVAVVSSVTRRLAASGSLADSRERAPVPILASVLEELGRSSADHVVVNVEDLWAERDPVNVPGTFLEHANFSRRCAKTIEELAGDNRAIDVLARLDAAQREPRVSRRPKKQ